MSKEKKEKTSPEETVETAAEASAETTAEPAETAEHTAEEFEAAQKKNEELSDRLMRSMAEFDNFKKRTAREKQEIGSFARVACIKELLGVADNFERALGAECKDADFYKGMDMIFKQLQDAFSRVGVTEIEAMNAPFDPEIHHAIKQVEDESFGENTVCQVLQKGYMLDGHVVRHAMVVVANP